MSRIYEVYRGGSFEFSANDISKVKNALGIDVQTINSMILQKGTWMGYTVKEIKPKKRRNI